MARASNTRNPRSAGSDRSHRNLAARRTGSAPDARPRCWRHEKRETLTSTPADGGGCRASAACPGAAGAFGQAPAGSKLVRRSAAQRPLHKASPDGALRLVVRLGCGRGAMDAASDRCWRHRGAPHPTLVPPADRAVAGHRPAAPPPARGPQRGRRASSAQPRASLEQRASTTRSSTAAETSGGSIRSSPDGLPARPTSRGAVATSTCNRGSARRGPPAGRAASRCRTRPPAAATADRVRVAARNRATPLGATAGTGRFGNSRSRSRENRPWGLGPGKAAL
jgi:hypothetical protein